ncbi:MAG: hypothetical protein EBS53_00170 [Bacteroidetes bacterium]|jgi:hypothetical protein|nr:hypothetical protein [Bacteroidota bacterium]
MADHVLNRIVFVKDPTVLPENEKHHEVVDSLAKANKLVVLLSHGNKYNFPAGWILPSNVKLLEYDLEMPSIKAAVSRIRTLLREHNVEVHSRHLDERDTLPIVLSGALVAVPTGTELSFLNGQTQYVRTRKTLETPTIVEQTEWDIL